MRSTADIWTGDVAHPSGTMTVAASEHGVVRIAFGQEDRAVLARELATLGTVREDPAQLEDTLAWLDRALAGDPEGPAPACDLRLVGTPFARDVLAAIARIPPGATRTYAALAADAGHPRAVRAAAHACATNPVPLVIGCHRIVRSDGTIGDYRGGRALKAHLLAGEARAAATR